MRSVAFAAFAIFFVTIAPHKSVPVFAALTRTRSAAERRRIAVKSVLYATAVLTVFSAWGDDLLRLLGISLAAIRIGGGLLLMLMAIEMVFGAHGSVADARNPESELGTDVAVFPIATPLIAGPGTITAVVVLMSEHTAWTTQAVIFAALVSVLLLTLVLFLLAGALETVIGDSAMALVSRVMGILLMALAAEFVVQGIRESLFP